MSSTGNATVDSVIKAAETAASPSGTTIPSATQIIDSVGNRWTLSGGVIYKNGALAGYTKDVTLVLYENSKIYEQNSAGAWYLWHGTSWEKSVAPGWSSPARTTIPSATQIIDSGGNRWTLSAGVIYVNDALAGYTRDVTLVLYDDDKIYEQNSVGQWYFWHGTTWVSSTDPGWSSPAGTVMPSATQIIDSGGNRWTLSAGVIYEDGKLAGFTKDVKLVLYDDGKIYQQNSAGDWYFWHGTTWVPGTDPRDGETLVISGTPRTSDVAGLAYSFVPTISNPGGGKLSFSIKNKPAWASFNAITGALTGTPNKTQVGTYSDIVLDVSNGSESASHAAFSITVTTGSATLSWTPPTENTNGTPLRDLAGFTIYYGTSANELTQVIQVANPSATSYVVSDLSAGTYYFAVTSYTSEGIQSAKSAVDSYSIL